MDKEKRKEYQKKYREKNKEKISLYKKERYKNNKERVRLVARKWRKKQKQKREEEKNLRWYGQHTPPTLPPSTTMDTIFETLKAKYPLFKNELKQVQIADDQDQEMDALVLTTITDTIATATAFAREEAVDVVQMRRDYQDMKEELENE